MPALLIAVGLGSLIQGSIGFGFSFVVSPIMLIVEPKAVPVAILALSVPMTVVMIVREFHSIDIRACLELSAGRVIGTIIGIWILSVVPTRYTGLVLSVIILAAVLMSVFRRLAPIFQRIKVGAGVVSGIAGTTTALGGAPSALAFRDRAGPEIRSTLGLTFLIGDFISIGGLALAQLVHASQFALALKLLPALVVGVALSGVVARTLSSSWVRAAILSLAGVGGLVTIIRNWP